ncbi:hypothetical protein N0V95_004996 [Ascochyta clinopodiicola]|nr:hypothetical protein N0V95_004996 [Ascochyta clinopodiicola]
MSSPSKRIGPGEFRSPPEAEMVFPFENLTKDTRRMIYNILLESMYRPLLDRRHGLYYKASRIPFALILANKFLHEEVTACSKEHVAARPIVLLCRQQERKYELGVEVIAAALVRMVHIGQLYDSRYHQNTDNESRLTHDFDFWTLKAPGKVFEAEMSRRESRLGLPPFRFYEFAFDDFYRSALMKLRRNAIQKISVRVLATNLIIVTSRLRRCPKTFA